jgi:hypothetical protein
MWLHRDRSIAAGPGLRSRPAGGGTDRIVSVLQEHSIQVVLANTRELKSITEAKAKTDASGRQDAPKLLVSGLLDGFWTPDERSRARRPNEPQGADHAGGDAREERGARGAGPEPLRAIRVTDAFGKAGQRVARHAGAAC